MKRNKRKAAFWKLEGAMWNARGARWTTYWTVMKTLAAAALLIRMLWAPAAAEAVQQVLELISN